MIWRGLAVAKEMHVGCALDLPLDADAVKRVVLVDREGRYPSHDSITDLRVLLNVI